MSYYIFGMLMLSLLLPTNLLATPTFAIKEAQNCAGCHDGGRSQRPYLERRCTLDCQGCHIDPSGGGPRNAWGKYYSHKDLNAYSFFKPEDPLKDESHLDLHYDGRIIKRESEGSSRTFPMSSEMSIRYRPFVKYLHFTYQALFMGRIGDDLFRNKSKDPRRLLEKYAVMVDNLPLNTYVRAYRGTPMYGLRRPNHTAWIREQLGLNQHAVTEALEIGATPNVPFFRASVMKGNPMEDGHLKQKGHSVHAGLRGVTLGWHLNGSTWDTDSSQTEIKMRAIGAGLKPWHFVLYGERNWRKVDWKVPQSERSPFIRLHPSSEISEYSLAFTGIPGVIAGYVHEEMRQFGTSHDRAGTRRNVYVDFHPIPFLQFEAWRRFESGARNLVDTLFIAHLYFDW